MFTHRIGAGRSLWAAALLVAFAATPALAGGSDPEVVLDEIFGHVESMCGGDGQGPVYDINSIAEAYFVPELAKPFEAAMEKGDLGFDVLVDAQDCQTSDLKLKIVETNAEDAIGRATFKNMGEKRVIDLVMAKVGDEWWVSDIVYGHREFSLKGAF